MDSGLHSRMASDVDMGVSGGGRLCLADSTLARCLFWICFYSRCGFTTVDVDAVCVARRAVLCEGQFCVRPSKLSMGLFLFITMTSAMVFSLLRFLCCFLCLVEPTPFQ